MHNSFCLVQLNDTVSMMIFMMITAAYLSCILLMMVQKSGKLTTWNVFVKPVVINGISTTNLN